MIRIKKLYSEPQTFDPIAFTDGINLILGEATEDNNKRNGVGKSLAIEFISYGLLKKYNESRVSLIPEETFPYKTLICLDFIVGSHSITCKRSIESHQCPILIVDGEESRFENLEDATQYLTALMFGSTNDDSIPSFRSLMGPLIRDERSEFKSITRCYDTARNIPPDYAPHLYMLGIDPSPYKEAKQLWLQIEKTSKAISKIKDDVVTITGKNFSEAKSDLNELTNQVRRIQDDLDALENIQGFDIVKQEILELEQKLDTERALQAALKSELIKIKLFQGDNYIDEDELAELYNQFRDGLGDFIKKEIQEVSEFKKKIDNFQKSLIDNKHNSISSELKLIEKNIAVIDKKYKEKLTVINQDGSLKSLKQTIAAHQKKVEEHSSLLAFVNKLTDYEKEKKKTAQERDNAIYTLDIYKNNADDVIASFEKTMLDIHEYVAGNKQSSFEIKILKNKEVVKFELRIHDDGSHSNEREKVFIYDLALLLNNDVADRHPGMLIHDNIFDVDNDTLIKSLNYLNDTSSVLISKQYVLTINSDKFHSDGGMELNLDLEKYTRASFTKDDRFLKKPYQELSKK